MGSNWAVDLKDIGAIYPWQGMEWLMVLVGVAFWIWWHVAQTKAENQQYEEEIAKYGSDAESIRKALDTHA